MAYKRTIFKITLISVISLFIITSLGFIFLVNFVNPNQYKPLIIDSVNHSTGRKLQLNGDIKWQIWPNIGLQVNDIRLSNPEGFTESRFVQIQTAKVTVDLLPLFRNVIIINDITIDGLVLNLNEKNNKNNWTFSHIDNQTTKNNSKAYFELHSLSLTNANIMYTNFDNKTAKEMKNINFRLDTTADGGIRFNSLKQQLNLDNVNFNLNNRLKGIIQLEVENDGHLSYTGKIALTQFSLNHLLKQLNQKPLKINNPAILDNINLSTKFSGNDKSAIFSDINVNTVTTNLQGTIRINQFSPLNIQNDLKANQLEVSDWIDTNGYKALMHSINLNGTVNNTSSGINKILLNQHLTIANIILYGINADDKIKYAEKTLTAKQFENPITLAEHLNTTLSPSSYTQKDLKQKTDLGKLTTNITLKNGILKTPNFLLNGPVIKMTNDGLANFNKHTIDYKLFNKLVSVPADGLLGHLTIIYLIAGNLDKPDTGIDKPSLQKQTIDYYTKAGKVGGVINNVKQGTVNLWNKVFH